MYEENKNNLVVNLIKILLVVLVLVLSVKMIGVIIANNQIKAEEQTMSENLDKLNEIAKSYFKGDLIPTESGKKNKVSLSTLKKKGLIKDIKDKKGKNCDMKKSYIEITRLDKEYQIKTYLVCDKTTDFINTFTKIKDNEEVSSTTTTQAKPTETTKKTTTKKKNNKTTKKTTTTTKKKTTKKTTTAKKKTTKKTTKPVTSTTTSTTTTTTTTSTTTQPTTTKPVVKTYLVSFNTNGGNEINPVSIIAGQKVNLPTPVREGYTFVGWFYHGERFNPDMEINADYVLVARWA